MAKIEKIKILGFRGIRNEITIDFGKKLNNLVLSGENGKGKSSLTDAIEWFFQDCIDHLRKEGCQESAYRHYRFPKTEDAIVNIITSDKDVFGEKRLQVIPISQGNDKYKTFLSDYGSQLESFINDSKSESIILRHAQLKDFINQTKTQKLVAVSSIIGFDIVTQTRDTISKVKGGLERDSSYRMIQGQISEKLRDIKIIIQPYVTEPSSTYNDVILTANELRKKLGGNIVVSDPISYKNSLDALSEKNIINPTVNKASEIISFIASLRSLIGKLNIGPEICAFFDDYNDLLGKKENLEKIILIELYRAGVEILEKKPELDECPLCGNEIINLELQTNIRTKLLELSKVQEQLKELKDFSIRIVSEINVIIDNIKTVLDKSQGYSEYNLGRWQQKTRELIIDLHNQIEEINKAASLFVVVTPQKEKLTKYGYYDDEINETLNILNTVVKGLELPEKERERISVFQTFTQLYEFFTRWIELNKMEGKYNKQIESLSRIIIKLEERERNEFNKILLAISKDVNEFYLSLHPDEGFDQLQLASTIDRGLEFEFYFKGDKITPPSKFMSESHLNTLGLCFFLASAIEFNKKCEFLILDDVVSSVDANHRLTLARLLRDDPRLNKKQFIILSHDNFWSTILRKTFPNWLHKKIKQWDYETGISFEDIEDIRKQVENCLSQGDVIGAARRTRDLVDISFREICEHYSIPLAFKQGDANENRELKELTVGISQFFGKNNGFDSSKPPLSDLDSCMWLMNIASHPDPRQLNLSENDVKTVLRDLDTFNSLFYNHTASCMHKAKKLIWNKQTRLFVECDKCKKPILQI